SARGSRIARELLAHQPLDTGFKAFNGAIESIKRRPVAWLLVFRSQSVHLFARFASARRARLYVATVACLNTPSPHMQQFQSRYLPPLRKMRRLTKQLPLVGEFTKRGKEVVNYGRNFLTFVAH
ncbi:hypothetical protein ACNVD4_07400, partial [Rhizobium sp. BR5]